MASQKLTILKQVSVNALRKNIKENIHLYEQASRPDWESNSDEYCQIRETSVAICGDSLSECLGVENLAEKSKERIVKGDTNRCIGIYNALRNLTLQQAADERIWTYLTHFIFWEYTHYRWPMPKENKIKKIKHIESHFFISGLRGMARDNAISRLWWMAHVCSRAKNYKLKESLDALLLMEDVRKEIMERSTFRSATILTSMMKFMTRSLKTFSDDPNHKKSLHNRDHFRKLCVEVNRIGGVRVLDSLSQSQLDNLIQEIIVKIGVNPDFPKP